MNEEKRGRELLDRSEKVRNSHGRERNERVMPSSAITTKQSGRRKKVSASTRGRQDGKGGLEAHR